MAAKITIQTLLDAGCHYGHQTRRWNPKMKSYIFGERNGIYILDLKQTMLGADKAYTFLKETAAKGGKILFVGTKKQAQEPVATQAQRCGMPYINQRWLGGDADQLRDYALPHQPHGGARGHGRGRPHGHPAQEGAGRAGQGAAPSSRPTSAASAT